MSDRSGRLAPLITAMSLASAEPAVRPASPPVAGERDAVWAALYDRHFDDVYRLVRRAGVSVADAEDVAQKVFDAMQSDQFYVFSHPKALGNVKSRSDAILAIQNPPDPFAERPEIGVGLRAALRQSGG